MKNSMENRKSERGGAGVKALMVIAVLALFLNAGLNYVPIAYQGASMKQEMDTIVVQASTIPANRQNPIDIAKNRVQTLLAANEIPTNAFVDVRNAKGVIQARVSYTKSVNILPFGIYKYNYQFDHTAVPAGFLTKEAAKTN